MPKAQTRDDVVYARVDRETMCWIYSVMADTHQPMREVVQRMAEFCRTSRSFKVPRRETTAERLTLAQKEREQRLRSKAAGEE